MLKREEAIRKLILNGYDDELASQLPKLFIADFLEKEQENLSEDLDIFIDRTQSGIITPWHSRMISLASIVKMGEKDMNENSVDGVFYNFCYQIITDFNHIVRRQPLQDILLEGGAMKLNPEFADFSNNPVYFEKGIIGKPEEYRDLCFVTIQKEESTNGYYIMFSDLLSLLKSKGFNEDSIATILHEKGNILMYLKYDDVMNLGKRTLKSNPHMLQKNIKDGPK